MSYPSGGGDVSAQRLALLAEPFALELVNNVTLPLSSGFLIGELLRPGAAVVGNVGLFLGTAGAVSTGVNAMGLYSEAGVLLAQTGDLTAALSAAGSNGMYLEFPLTVPYKTAANTNYYVGVLSHMTTPPLVGGFFAGAGVSYPAVHGHLPVITLGGQAALPASFSIGSVSMGNAGYWFTAAV